LKEQQEINKEVEL
jgi:hypothetical protein